MSAFAYLLGDIGQTVYELLGNRPYPSLDDALYLVFYPLMLAGLLSFPVWRRDLAGRVRLGLDIGLVALGGSAVVIYLVLGPPAIRCSRRTCTSRRPSSRNGAATWRSPARTPSWRSNAMRRPATS